MTRAGSCQCIDYIVRTGRKVEIATAMTTFLLCVWGLVSVAGSQQLLRSNHPAWLMLTVRSLSNSVDSVNNTWDDDYTQSALFHATQILIKYALPFAVRGRLDPYPLDSAQCETVIAPSGGGGWPFQLRNANLLLLRMCVIVLWTVMLTPHCHLCNVGV